MSALDNLMGRIGRRYWIARIDRALGRAYEQGLLGSWLLHELDHRMKYAKRLDVPYPPRPVSRVQHPAQDGTCMYCHRAHAGCCDGMVGTPAPRPPRES